MDIHAPEHPIHSWREFAIHIAVVTVGILIAIALEGVRESFATHHLLHETRETFHQEAEVELDFMTRELPSVASGSGGLHALVAQMPSLAQSHPEQVTAELLKIENPDYFFSANAWQAALSTGALAHMRPEEASAYAFAAEGTRIYTEWQGKALEAEMRAKAFWQAHPRPTTSEITEGDELIRLFASDESTLASLGPQLQRDLDRVARAATTH